ncbi:MAG: site-specific DNA-methyltransferase [Planctomycetes bacterium]|nr:site-specific DNA-methyltransferase [Planctomycetota bacterium]
MPEVLHNIHCDGFEAISLTAKSSKNLSLFKSEDSNRQAEQLRIFRKLEKKLLLFNTSSFENQVHFQFAYQTPVQRWFPYREGYSVELVNSFIKSLKISGNIFDPFSGSGTTLLAARNNNINSLGVDVNPISVLVARVENEKYSTFNINNIRSQIETIKALERPKQEYQTTFNLANKVFNADILQSLLHFKNYIKSIEDKKIRDLVFVAWLSIIEEVSNIKKEGNGIKYKNRKRTPSGYINIDKEVWENQNFPEDKFVFVKFKLYNQLEAIFYDVVNSYGNCEKRPKIYQGSCLEFNRLFSDEIELTFFSPPYCNCFDYFEIHKVELWLGDFIKDKEDFRKLRNTGFRSNTNSLNYKPIVYKNKNLESLISLIDTERLWSKKIPSVIRGYFDDTNTLLNKLYDQTVHGGHVGIVVGNSAYSGVIIPTDTLIVEIAQQIGFKVKNIFVTRHLTTSSQQKKKLSSLKNYLRESVIIIEK